MKEYVGIVITNNYNIAVNFEYCLLLTPFLQKISVL